MDIDAIIKRVGEKVITCEACRAVYPGPLLIHVVSQPKHMLWVLKRTVSMRQFF